MPVGDYSDEFKAEALAALDANGGNILRTARELDVPESTLRDWSNGLGTRALPSHVRDQKRSDLSDRLDTLAVRLVDGMTEEKIRKANVRDLMTAFGIAFDKLRLLRNEATSITENREHEELRSRLESKLLAATNGQSASSMPADLTDASRAEA